MNHNIGKNIARIRGLRQLTQKEVAAKINLAQPEYSKIEQKGEIDDHMLTLIAKALDVTPDAIRYFNEEAAVNVISSTLNDNAAIINQFPIFNINPIEKLIETMEANRILYQQLLKGKDDIIKGKEEIITELRQQLSDR